MPHRAPTIALTLLSLSVTAVLGATASAPAAAHGGGTKTVEVRMDDDCDPTTFPAEAGCTGDGDTTFAELVEELLDDGEHGKWKNSPDKVTVRQGDTVVARNVGGEPHTFSRVQNYGGGCVQPLNDLLGLSAVPECADPAQFPGTLVAPAQKRTVEHLHAGTHKFQCLIHPWMHTTVTVRAS